MPKQIPDHWFFGNGGQILSRCDGQALYYSQLHDTASEDAQLIDQLKPLEECRCPEHLVLGREIELALKKDDQEEA